MFGVVLRSWRSRFCDPEGNRDPAFLFLAMVYARKGRASSVITSLAHQPPDGQRDFRIFAEGFARGFSRVPRTTKDMVAE